MNDFDGFCHTHNKIPKGNLDLREMTTGPQLFQKTTPDSENPFSLVGGEKWHLGFVMTTMSHYGSETTSQLQLPHKYNCEVVSESSCGIVARLVPRRDARDPLFGVPKIIVNIALFGLVFGLLLPQNPLKSLFCTDFVRILQPLQKNVYLVCRKLQSAEKEFGLKEYRILIKPDHNDRF